jgi:hypothetical protein
MKRFAMNRFTKLSLLASALVFSVASWAVFTSDMDRTALETEIANQYSSGTDILAIAEAAMAAGVVNTQDLFSLLVAASADREENAAVAVAALVAAGYNQEEVRSAAVATRRMTAGAADDAIAVGRNNLGPAQAPNADTSSISESLRAGVAEFTLVVPGTGTQTGSMVVIDNPTNSPYAQAPGGGGGGSSSTPSAGNNGGGSGSATPA